jgi:hypothetical protein
LLKERQLAHLIVPATTGQKKGPVI